MRVWAAQSGFESMLECAAAQRPLEAWDGGLAFRSGGSGGKGTCTIPKKLVPLASVLSRFCNINYCANSELSVLWNGIDREHDLR